MSTASPEKLDLSRIGTVAVYLLERNSEVASGLRTMLRGVGMSGVKAFLTPEELESNLASSSPDVLILSESEGSNIFEITKRIRRVAVGRNPFTVILLLVLPNKPESVKAALMSGADSALMKPVASAQLVERVAQLAFNRAPFIATTDYIGPERRASGRPSDIPLIQTINTLRYKMEGKAVTAEALDKAIATVTPKLWHGQLKSHSLKLKRFCDAVFELHRLQHPPAELKASLLALVTALEEAAVTTQRIEQGDLLKTCNDLAREIKILADELDSLDEQKIKKISLIPQAFELARQRLSPDT